MKFSVLVAIVPEDQEQEISLDMSQAAVKKMIEEKIQQINTRD